MIGWRCCNAVSRTTRSVGMRTNQMKRQVDVNDGRWHQEDDARPLEKLSKWADGCNRGRKAIDSFIIMKTRARSKRDRRRMHDDLLLAPRSNEIAKGQTMAPAALWIEGSATRLGCLAVSRGKRQDTPSLDEYIYSSDREWMTRTLYLHIDDPTKNESHRQHIKMVTTQVGLCLYRSWLDTNTAPAASFIGPACVCSCFLLASSTCSLEIMSKRY